MKIKPLEAPEPHPFRRFLKPRIVIPFAAAIVFLTTSFALFLWSKLAPPPTYKAKSPIHYVKQAIGPTVQVKPAGKNALLPGAKWVPQTFNNCAPATASMILQYFGFSVDQNTIRAHLRTNVDDKNVFTYEIQEYLRKNYDIESKLLYNGNRETVKLLLANGIYVMVEDWLHPNEDIGHVTILRGYDDEQGVFIADDSFIGVNITYKYDEFEETQWKAFNREYLPMYKKEQEALVKKIVGEDWDEKIMYQKAVQKALQETSNNEKDMYAYFNLGTSYYALGEYQKASDAFEKSRKLGWPRRMLWYQIQPVQTLIKLKKYNEAIALADQGLWSNDTFAELHLEKARAYKGLGNTDKAKQEAQSALFHSPNFQKAKDFLASL